MLTVVYVETDTSAFVILTSPTSTLPDLSTCELPVKEPAHDEPAKEPEPRERPTFLRTLRREIAPYRPSRRPQQKASGFG